VPHDQTGIRLVILDWAGTAVDHGSRAPLTAFARAFAARGVEVTPEEARGPMGLGKKDHLRAMLRLPAVARRWRERHGGDATEDDLDDLYRRFVPLQLEVIDEYAEVVPELLDCVGVLRGRGLAVGATTGYFREAAERVYRRAADQGYRPDHCVCAEEVPAGRPAPWMVFRVMEALRVFPPAAVVKVGDTVPDVGEGLSAGAWSVGVVRSSSEVGCTAREWAALPAPEQLRRSANCRAKLLAAGAHAVLETLAELPALLDDFNARIGRASFSPLPCTQGRGAGGEV
jgi:phosphonoacetaldehyde hydrolase